MGRRKGEKNQKSQALQPKKKRKIKQRKMLHQEDQGIPCRNRKSQALQPKKTRKFKQRKMLYQEDQGTLCPRPPPPPFQPLMDSDLKTENPCLEIVLAFDDTEDNKLEAFVGTLPILSLSPCPTLTPSRLSLVPYEAQLSSRTRSTWKTMNVTLSNYWNRKKLATLSSHFNPIPFGRERPSDIATHRLLLNRIGLWNFLHLDFDRNIHSDLIKQLVVYYNLKKPAHRRSHVNGCPILVSRATLARALSLPIKRLNLHGNDAARGGLFMASEEETVFVEELVSNWLVLQDDRCELPGEVLKVKRLIRERRLEDVDWAGLIWFMVKRELLKGDKLVNCYYASHMQLLLKNQKPQLFRDHVEIAGFLDAGADVYDEEKVDNILSGLEGPEIANIWTGLFSEESVKLRILNVEENAVGDEESGRKRKTETTLERFNKRRNSTLEQCLEGRTLYGETNTNDLIAVDDDCKGNQLQEPQTTVTQSPGNFEAELNITSEGQDHNVVENVEKVCTPCEQNAIQKEDGNRELKLLTGEDETKLSTEDLFVNSGELFDSPEKKLNVDFECNEKEHRHGELTDLEFDSANGILMNEHCNDERLKIEYSSDFTASRMHGMSRLDSEFERMNLDSSNDNGEKEFGIDALEDCEIISEKFCTNELHEVKMEDTNKELKLLSCENKSKLSTKEVKFHHMDESKLSEVLAKEVILDNHMISYLVTNHDNGEKGFGLDSLVEDCKNFHFSEKFCSLDELCGVKMEDGNKELKLLPSEEKCKQSNEEVKLLHHEDESKLSEGLAKEEIFDSRTGDLLDSQKKQVNNDSECKQMDYNQPQLNCLHEIYGTGLESVSANNMLMNEESSEERLKVECSSDLSMSRMRNLHRQEINFHQMDLVLSEDKCEAEFRLNVLVEDHNMIDGNFFTSDEQHAIEMEDGNRKPVQNEGLVEDEHFDGKIGELLESREKKVGNILLSSKQHDRKNEDGDSRLVRGKYEIEFSQGLVKEELCDARVGDSQNKQELEIGFIEEKSTMGSENQHTEISIEDEKPELLDIVKPETSGLNEIRGAEMDLQNKSGLKVIPFVEPFAVEAESFMNLDYSPLDNSLKGEIDCLNDRQFERLNETQKITGINSAAGESFDIDLCSERVELWMSRLKSASQRRAQMDKGTNAMLLKTLETKNQIIEESEKLRRQEQQKYQKNIQRLKRELYLMENISNEYKKALNQVDKSFSEYRKRVQLPEEPIYVDHPDGGGKVVLATELELSKLKQEPKNL